MANSQVPWGDKVTPVAMYGSQLPAAVDAQSDLNAASVTTTGNSVWANTSGKKRRLMGGSISANAACSIAFCDNAANGTVLYRTPALLANTPYNFVVAGGQGILGGSVNDAIIGVASANATVTGTLWGTAE